MVLVTEPFEAVARSSALASGFAKLPIVVLPADLDERSPDLIRAAIDQRMADIRDALCRGAT